MDQEIFYVIMYRNESAYILYPDRLNMEFKKQKTWLYFCSFALDYMNWINYIDSDFIILITQG